MKISKAKGGFVYILASARNGTLYVGVTSDLPKRVSQHRAGMINGFTKEHGVHILVWYEHHDEIASAITREKAVKRWRRDWKVRLIEEMNPLWRDLFNDLFE